MQFALGYPMIGCWVESFQQVELPIHVSVADLLQSGSILLPLLTPLQPEERSAKPEPDQQKQPANCGSVSNNNGYCSEPLSFGVVCLWHSWGNT